MAKRTSLPILLSTILLSALPACGSSSSGGTGGSGASSTGGSTTGGSDTGGSTTGGSGGSDTGGSTTGGSSTGGSSTGGSTTGGSGGAPECTGHTSQVYGCIQSAKFEENPPIPFAFQTTGTVTAVRAPAAGEECGPGYWYQVGFLQAPEVMIDLSQDDDSTLTVGLAIPGFAASAIQVGDVLVVKHNADVAGFGGKIAALKVERDGALVAGVGESAPVGLTPSEGAVECYQEDSLCGREEREMDVADPGGAKVSIGNGTTVDVGDLTVTNDRFIHNYDVSGGCNFGLSVEYLMGVAAK